MMKYFFALFFCLNLCLISIMPVTVRAEQSDRYSPDLLCDGSFLASTTNEEISAVFLFIRENDNRSISEKFTIGPIDVALQQDCGERNRPLHIAFNLEQVLRL